MELPWYHWLERKVAPTDSAVKIGLVAIAAFSLLLLWKGDTVTRAAWFIYLISP